MLPLDNIADVFDLKNVRRSLPFIQVWTARRERQALGLTGHSRRTGSEAG